MQIISLTISWPSSFDDLQDWCLMPCLYQTDHKPNPYTTTMPNQNQKPCHHLTTCNICSVFICVQYFFSDANKIVTYCHPNVDHFAAPVAHPATDKTISIYRKLATYNITHNVWIMLFGKKFVNLAQEDYKTKTADTNSFSVMTCEHIKNIPEDRVVTYGSA